jgi:hypothetical protein
MNTLTKLFELVLAIREPQTQLFIALLVVAAVAGLAVYAAILAIRRSERP